MKKLSVVLAVKNEEDNIGRCLNSIDGIADEIIIVDENSVDKTTDIAKNKGAKIYQFSHKKNFHETKQVALEKANFEWVLQLDADEALSKELREEIKKVKNMGDSELLAKEKEDSKNKNYNLFKRHQSLIEARDGKIGDDRGEITAFFVPRVNYFLGKPLTKGGVYPDGVIRLVKRGKARFPAKSVHEQIEVKGRVSWLMGDLEHHDSPTLRRYIARLNRYTDLRAVDFKRDKLPKNVFYLFWYTAYKPLFFFFKFYFRHLGFRDGIRGFLWAAFSASHYPIAYYKYWTLK